MLAADTPMRLLGDLVHVSHDVTISDVDTHVTVRARGVEGVLLVRRQDLSHVEEQARFAEVLSRERNPRCITIVGALFHNRNYDNDEVSTLLYALEPGALWVLFKQLGGVKHADPEQLKAFSNSASLLECNGRPYHEQTDVLDALMSHLRDKAQRT
jgi:hypothetical protein